MGRRSLTVQKRMSAQLLRCGKRKVWMDPNERHEIGAATTKNMVRKLIQDGFIIRKPKKIHSRFRARRRKLEKKRGRHLGIGSRKGTANARCSTKGLWIMRLRAMRRLLARYRIASTIDRKMYHRYYLRAKGGTFKNKAALIDRIASELSEKKRSQQLLEQYKIRREEATTRRLEKEQRKQKLLEEQLQIAEEAEQIRLTQERQKKEKMKQKKQRKDAAKKAEEERIAAEKRRAAEAKKRKEEAKKAKKKKGKQDDEEPKKKKRKRKKKEPEAETAEPEPQKKKRKRKKKGGGGGAQ